MRLKDEAFYKAIRDFLNVYLVKQKNYSPNTQRSYREALNLLLLYFKTELGMEYTQVGFEDLTYSNISGFLAWLDTERHCSPSTINSRLMAIRSFTKYASIVDPSRIYLQVDVGNVDVRKCQGKVVEFLSVPALTALMEQPDLNKKNGFRDYCFMKLMYDTAARCQELVDVRIGDLSIRGANPAIYLTGKGRKMRIVPLSVGIVDLLKRYMDVMHPAPTRKDSDYLFYTTIHGTRGKMSTDTVSLFMKKYGIAGKQICAEIPDRVHPHQLRHSRAMHLYRSGMPLVLLSEFLGHADVNTTRVYAWADTEMKRRAIQRATCINTAEPVEPIWENDEQMIKRLYGLV